MCAFAELVLKDEEGGLRQHYALGYVIVFIPDRARHLFSGPLESTSSLVERRTVTARSFKARDTLCSCSSCTGRRFVQRW